MRVFVLIVGFVAIFIVAASAPSLAAASKPAHHPSGKHKHHHHHHHHHLLDHGIGRILLHPFENEIVCTKGMDRGLTGRAAHRPAYAHNEGFYMIGEILHPGGIALLDCGRNAPGPPTMVVAYGLFTRSVLWRVNVKRADAYDATLERFFMVTQETTPPSGLSAGSTNYTLTAFNVSTGAIEWRVPFAAEGAGNADNHSLFGIFEGPSGIAGHPEDIVIEYLGTSAYDAATGVVLWQLPYEYFSQASGGYVTDGIVEVSGYKDNAYGEHITGFDAQTDTEIWDLRLPTSCEYVEDGELVGMIEWEFGRHCIEAHEVATGQLLVDQEYPSAGQATAADHSVVLAYDGSNLALYATSDLGHPIWTEPAGMTAPLVVSPGHVLVEAPSGMLVLSASNGQIVAQVPKEFSEAEGGVVGPIDGLVEKTAEDGQTIVLDLDH